MKGVSIQTISTWHITTIHVTITKYHHSHPSPPHTTPPLHIPTTCPHITSHHTTQPRHRTTYNLTTIYPHHITLITPLITTTFSTTNACHHHCQSPALLLLISAFGFPSSNFPGRSAPQSTLLLPISGLFHMRLPER